MSYQRFDYGHLEARIAAVREAKIAAKRAVGREQLPAHRLDEVLPDPPEGTAPPEYGPDSKLICIACQEPVFVKELGQYRDKATGVLRLRSTCRRCRGLAEARQRAQAAEAAAAARADALLSCPMCGRGDLTVDDFYKCNRKNIGKQRKANCIECCRARARADYHAKTLEERRAWTQRARERSRQQPVLIG